MKASEKEEMDREKQKRRREAVGLVIGQNATVKDVQCWVGRAANIMEWELAWCAWAEEAL